MSFEGEGTDNSVGAGDVSEVNEGSSIEVSQDEISEDTKIEASQDEISEDTKIEASPDEISEDSNIFENGDSTDIYEDTDISGNLETEQSVAEGGELPNAYLVSEDSEIPGVKPLEENEYMLSQGDADSGKDEGNFDNIGNWDRVPPETTYEENMAATNPNYDLDKGYRDNCQRCVPTYEMRARGYDVTALPCTEYDDYLAYHPYEVWENATVVSAKGDGFDDIQTAMHAWGDGSRAQICVAWKYGDEGHTFIAEEYNGTTYFFDPQNNKQECSDYFYDVLPGSVTFCRIDNLQPSSKILDCCKGVEKDD